MVWWLGKKRRRYGSSWELFENYRSVGVLEEISITFTFPVEWKNPSQLLSCWISHCIECFYLVLWSWPSWTFLILLDQFLFAGDWKEHFSKVMQATFQSLYLITTLFFWPAKVPGENYVALGYPQLHPSKEVQSLKRGYAVFE